MLKLENVKLAVVGLGYVGLSLVLEFGKKMSVVGFDISKTRIDALKEALSAPELLTKLSTAAVLQSDRLDWENTSKKTWSELLALAKRSKEGAC
ncbi:UDP-glucose/GDP-mannose dehydrogenase family, NAD binding domain [compost metagenome]|jgi:UDP-N-acetyl-D-mannosaminuronate dehydrogenase|uniref:hypothetical protein n=1 Tax=Pseudomonas TaxID=286 RepID=UPI000F9C9F8F|nr:hypothetical protein PS843_05511 [Pseudomonas fluorescens]